MKDIFYVLPLVAPLTQQEYILSKTDFDKFVTLRPNCVQLEMTKTEDGTYALKEIVVKVSHG